MTRTRGFSLLEMLVAVSMLALLMTGAVSVLRIALRSSERIKSRMAVQRRVSRAQADLREEIAGLMPVEAQCGAAQGGPSNSISYFLGEADEMRFVSAFSLEERFRGAPQALEFKVVSGQAAGQLRLIVNQQPWPGSSYAAPCVLAPSPSGGVSVHFAPVQSGPNSFVLADRLTRCRFSYLHGEWKTTSLPGDGFPEAVRIEMAPFFGDVVIPIRARGES